MKAFFVIMLVASVLSAFSMFCGGMIVFAHNQYEGRYEFLHGGRSYYGDHASAHLGLTEKELALCDEYTADAYRDSVEDGYRLGNGYYWLMDQGLAMSGLLFLTSAIGIRAVRRAKGLPAS